MDDLCLLTTKQRPLPSQPQPRLKYINPTVPPPGYPDTSWSSQVDDFLSRPGQSAMKVKRKLDSEPGGGGRIKRTNFTPKAPILAPSPSQDDVNELDTKPEDKIYSGEILVSNLS